MEQNFVPCAIWYLLFVVPSFCIFLCWCALARMGVTGVLTKRSLASSAWLLLLLLGSAHSHSECSRDISRTVRDFVHERLLKVLNVPVDSLPESCPFHPAADLFWDQVCARVLACALKTRAE